MTRTKLTRRGPKKHTERAREAAPPKREEGWASEDGGQRVLEGLRRGVAVSVRVPVRVRVKVRILVAMAITHCEQPELRAAVGLRVRIGVRGVGGLGSRIELGLKKSPECMLP